MKGKLEELDEPVDDLMEVSKVQTQILNLTHNQVDIFDSATQEFRSTYDIMKDISEIWDSLSSTSRANLTEILFGRFFAVQVGDNLNYYRAISVKAEMLIPR